ncbi:MAG TPA: hypothetical protein VFT66_19065 [Roseiflexaceae bacterium]|jgi:hypothetical protein|nr:hypothetical protein [Roseiflexaceae bacterium]
MSQPDERLRILKLVEHGQVSAEEGAQLMAAVESGTATGRTRTATSARSLRIRVTDLDTQRQKVNVTIPTSLISTGLKLGARLIPNASPATMDELLRAVETGATGRVFEAQDREQGERIEIFVE